MWVYDAPFIPKVVKKFNRFKEQIKKVKKQNNPNFLEIYLEDWNNRTFIIYHRILDFLGFPQKDRMQIIPTKMDRDFEAFSDSHEAIDHKPCENIRRIREYG